MTEKENLVLPMKYSKENYDKIFKALYNLKDQNISRDKLVDATGLNKVNLSRAITFLKSINALEKSKRDIILTDDGVEYARNIALDLEDQAKIKFNELLRENDIVKKTLTYISVQDDLDEVTLKKKILGFSGKTTHYDNEVGANTLYEMLIWADVISNLDNKIILETTKTLKLEIRKESVAKTEIVKKIERNLESNDNIEYRIIFNIDINSETDFSKLSEIIKLIRESI